MTRGKTQLEPAFLKKGINIKATEVIHDTNGQQYDWTPAKKKKNPSQDAFLKMCCILSCSLDQAPPLLWIMWCETRLLTALGFISKSCTGKKQLFFLSSSIPDS